MWSLSLVMSECSISGRGQDHVSNFYSKSLVYRWNPQHVRDRFIYDTCKTMEATRLRHGWVHMFITHRLTETLQLHNFNLLRTCRTSSFCTVAWQLARFQLTWRIARSLGDTGASCHELLCKSRSENCVAVWKLCGIKRRDFWIWQSCLVVWSATSRRGLDDILRSFSGGHCGHAYS